ncbi:MAG: NYN domain-containing protein [Chlorobium sp.]|nr:MAG: NYN domain-containing protein [Chlorobium sp.]
MKTYTYIDNSNLFIEGRRVSAVAKGMAPSIYDAMNHYILDHDWEVSYRELHNFLCGQNKSEIGGAKLWGSPPPGDTFWSYVEKQGFEKTVFDKNYQGKEKKIDVAIAHSITKDAYTIIDKEKDEIALVAGDKDFVPVVEDLVKEGYNVQVVFWDHVAKELRDAASNFLSLDKYLTVIGKYKTGC